MSEINPSSRLKALSGADISTVEIPRDLRKFRVRNSAEDEIGFVEDLLYDVTSRKVRYVVIQILPKMSEGSKRSILAPIGMVEMALEENVVRVAALGEDLIQALPDYKEGEVNPGVENIIRLAYSEEGPDGTSPGITGNNTLNEAENFYSHFHFNVQGLSDAAKAAEKTRRVKGLFDDGLEAETAITELLSNGFSKADIELSSEQELNADKAGSGSVVTVKVRSEEAALMISKIMDKSGCVSVFEDNL